MASSRCTVNYDGSTMDTSKSDIYDAFEKPKRVINIEKTLEYKKGIHFLKPQDWKFHVLSHTWSRLLRHLSEKIGHKIGFSTLQDEDAYNSAFEKEDFSEELCYTQLLEVFEMLQADGVKLIWFDALCMNQTSQDEKSHEINNMGQYFSLSIGSYVLMHGVGEVNKLWGQGRGGDLPRWFTRVWTFQEFLLPRQVSFLVEGGVDPKFVAMVNHIIQEEKKNGLCRCFLDMDSEELDELLLHFSLNEEDLKWMGGFELRNPKWKSIVQLIHERVPPAYASASSQTWSFGPTHYGYQEMCCQHDNKTNKTYYRHLSCEKMQRINAIRKNPTTPKAAWDATDYENQNNIICNDLMCNKCGSKPMIRRAKHIKGREKMPYFVDREVFLALMQCDSRMVEKSVEDPQKACKLVKPTEGIQQLRGLYCALATEGNWRPCHVICEVGWRLCSEEEDRVLAILGLLGVRLIKLRTGKSLQHQILELAVAGGSAMLVELCALNQKGASLPGMSWAPDFHGHNQKLEHASRPRDVSIQVQSLGQDGRLQLKAKMVWGKVAPCDRKRKEVGQVSQYKLIVHNVLNDDQGHSVKDSNEAICLFLTLKTKIEYPTSEDDDQRLQRILHFDFEEKDNMVKVFGSFEISDYNISNLDREVSFLVRLLLLGEDEIERKLLLICLSNKFSKHVTKSHEELHKVGSITIKDMPMDLQSTLDSNFHTCVIGGFGKDLTNYIHLY